MGFFKQVFAFFFTICYTIEKAAGGLFMKPLNEKQQKVLAFLQERAQDGLPPTVREICAAADIKSTSTVHAYLKVLEEGGYISRQSGLSRAIRLPGESVARVPLLGKVTAGQPILAVEEVEDYVPCSARQRRSTQKSLTAIRPDRDKHRIPQSGREGQEKPALSSGRREEMKK